MNSLLTLIYGLALAISVGFMAKIQAQKETSLLHLNKKSVQKVAMIKRPPFNDEGPGGKG